ncbi:MAG: riboflavin biosynthesis protein RibF [Bdellovibrionales bacterium GWA2_49_15]|nr:MAG: riboflavin biosynthesis protein RibF [Bdellovibrionales bacterium GWA2_49_15]
MDILQGLQTFNGQSIALTIGNFDGVHLGHREFIQASLCEGQKFQLPLVVLTFTPHPGSILKGRNHFLINSYEERRELLESLGVQILVELKFDRDLSTLSPENFLSDYVLKFCNVQKLFIGHDFAFGANKVGTATYLQKLCHKLKIDFTQGLPFKIDGRAISSSHIRELISSGQMRPAKMSLGRPFFLSGRVIKGDGRGRQIGFPTANLLIAEERILPSKGVYATMTKSKGMNFQSITNVGNNPTFLQTNELFVESHIFDFSNDIYGEEIEVYFLEKIREEMKFSNVNELVAQIRKDIEISHKIHGEKC